MAHVWRNNGHDVGWTPTVLDGDGLALGSSAALRRIDDVNGAAWMLFAASSARVLVNGLPVSIGIVVLADRDEIRVPSEPPLYFSTETLAEVGPFPESCPRGFCPRCRQPIAPCSPAVRCPGCGLSHHASEDLACWTYSPQCAGCSHDTALDAGFRWTPEDL
jgi:hypothetical protein